MPDPAYQLTGIYQLLLKWRYPVLGLVLATAIISALVAWMLPNEYKSTTVFYSTDLNTVNPDQVLGGNSRNTELFGNSADIDRLLTIAYSQPLAEYIIRKHGLAAHYHSDTTDEASRQYVLEEFLSNFTAEHTERDAIALTFYDQDRNLAAAVANDMAARIDAVNQQLTYENRKKVLDIFNHRYRYLEQQYHQMRDSLRQSRKRFRIIGSQRDTHESRNESHFLAKQLVETETELKSARAEAAYLQKAGLANAELTRLKARISGLENAFAALTSENGNLINYETHMAGTDLVSGLEAQFAGLQSEYIKAKKSFMNAQLAMQGNISSIYIVQKAYPATKKARPVRWLIVAGSTFLAFLLAVALVALLEMMRSPTRTGHPA